MAVLLPNGKQQYDAANGVPAVGYALWTYDVGTTNPRTTWSNEGQSAANTNPIILDARGEAVIFWSGDYTVTLKDNVGSTIWSVDGVNSNAASLTDNYVVDTGAANAYIANGITASILVAGLKVAVKISNDNTGASTLNYGGLGIKPIVTNGSALHGGELKAGVIYILEYDGTNFQLLNPSNGATATEIAAGVVPSNINYPPGDPRRYNAKLDGVTDDTAALQQWSSILGNHAFPGGLTAIISASIPMVAYSTYTFGEGALIQTATNDISLFTATSKTNITIRGGRFYQTAAGTAPSVGGIKLVACSDCLLEDNEFIGMQFSGILLSACVRCTVRSNYIHDCLGGMQNSADIYVESSATGGLSAYNIIDGNICNGPNFEFGIAVWDPYAGILPIHNIVTNNRIKAHNGYGILIYMPTSGDSFNQIIGNHIQDISAFAGLPTPNPDSGAGIYLAGAGMGGTVVIGNTVQNCCITTSSTSLAPAGIGVNGSVIGSVPIVIQGNTVEGMTKYHGILLTSCQGGASVVGNTIRQPATNITGDALRVVNADSVNVANNTILQANATTNQEGIVFAALGVNCTNCTCTGNTVRGGHHAQIRLLQSGGFQVQILSVTGNILSGGDASCVPVILDTAAAADVTITGNIMSSQGVAMQVNACTTVRVANNRLRSTGGATIFATTGACTSSYYDKTNSGTGTGVGISNGGTLFLIESHGSAVPVAGTWAIGDRVEQSVPVVGNPKGWRCTVAGAPGTWVSEGNL